jgi:hypothetical protein
MKYFPPAALAALSALTLAACQAKPGDEPTAEAAIDPTVAAVVSEAKAPAFAAPADPATAGLAPPSTMLGEESNKTHTFNVKPTAPPAGAEAATETAE